MVHSCALCQPQPSRSTKTLLRILTASTKPPSILFHSQVGAPPTRNPYGEIKPVAAQPVTEMDSRAAMSNQEIPTWKRSAYGIASPAPPQDTRYAIIPPKNGQLQTHTNGGLHVVPNTLSNSAPSVPTSTKYESLTDDPPTGPSAPPLVIELKPNTERVLKNPGPVGKPLNEVEIKNIKARYGKLPKQPVQPTDAGNNCYDPIPEYTLEEELTPTVEARRYGRIPETAYDKIPEDGDAAL